MFQNYLKIAWRNIRKNKTTSAINILGLTIGLTSCFLIALYIQHELSYDNFEQNRNRIARVIMEYSFDGSPESQKGNFTSVRVASVFKRNFPEVLSAVKMVEYERVIKYEDKLINEKKFMYADSSFFSVFSFKLLSGDPHTVLSAPHQIVITASAAKKYFGENNPVGKALKVGTDSNYYQITGVVEDCPASSQIRFDFLASFSSLGIPKEYEDTYWDANYTTYLLLTGKDALAPLQDKIASFMKKEMAGQGATIHFYLEPFSRIHLYSPYNSFEPNTNISYIYILAGVALLILLIACFTYINLGTARSMERAKEVGIRKVIGAGKQQLFWQFIGESVLICILSLILSISITCLLLPYFNALTGKLITAQSMLSWQIILFAVLIITSVALLAGSYPALILIGFRPVSVLKGSFKNTGHGQWLRKSLIVFQFSISVFLIIATLLIQKQLYFIRHKSLGYDRNHVLVMPLDKEMRKNISLIKQEFKSYPGIISVSGCGRSPVEGGGGYNMRSSVMPSNQQMSVTANPVDEEYVKTTGLQLIAGNDFTEQDIKDASIEDPKKVGYHFILNESAAAALGWTARDAVGKKMFLDDSRPGVVSGVVKDFNFQSLHNPIKPFVLFTEPGGYEMLIKLNGSQLQSSITFLEGKWKNLVTNRPFEYRFMDEDYNQLYSSELRLGTVMNLFATLAIILACIGMFGMSSYSVQQRVKEIGIRKVLGAGLLNIILNLSKDFIRLSLIAIIIALPVSWWAMHAWLQNYAYKTGMDYGMYLIACLGTLILVAATVSIHAISAAIANPVKSLRSE